MTPETAVEVSRWIREAEARVARQMAAAQQGEAFKPSPSWGQIFLEEAARAVVISLFTAILLVWVAVLI